MCVCVSVCVRMCVPCCFVTASKPVMEAKQVGSVSVTMDGLNGLKPPQKLQTHYLNSYKKDVSLTC